MDTTAAIAAIMKDAARHDRNDLITVAILAFTLVALLLKGFA